MWKIDGKDVDKPTGEPLREPPQTLMQPPIGGPQGMPPGVAVKFDVITPESSFDWSDERKKADF